MTPADVGLAAGDRRCTPGLRREEVAQLAAVSTSWYTWLEQGRNMRPSPAVLDAIARVLRLDAGERAHLFRLARVELPLGADDDPREAPPELDERSPAFRAWWPRHDVLAEQSGTKAIVHRELGPLRLHHLQSTPTSDPELRLTVYVPADERTRTALAGLR